MLSRHNMKAGDSLSEKQFIESCFKDTRRRAFFSKQFYFPSRSF